MFFGLTKSETAICSTMPTPHYTALWRRVIGSSHIYIGRVSCYPNARVSYKRINDNIAVNGLLSAIRDTEGK